MPQVIRDLDEPDLAATEHHVLHGGDLAVPGSAGYLGELDVEGVFDVDELAAVELAGFEFGGDDHALGFVEKLDGDADGGHFGWLREGDLGCLAPVRPPSIVHAAGHSKYALCQTIKIVYYRKRLRMH